jgi:integrase/recombinase XerC/integrase/recombinase XerD
MDEIDEYLVREFILHLQQRKLKVSSINNRIRALRAFASWAYREDFIKTNRLVNIKPPRIPQSIVDTLSDEEIMRIMESLNASTISGCRNAAIISIFLDAGLRLGEVPRLVVENINLDQQWLKVMGKGGKERIVAFGTETKRILMRYLGYFRGEPVNPSIKSLFLTNDGYAITKEAVKSIVRRLGKTAGVPRLHPHLMRHSYATRFLVNGGNVLILRQNLGHTTLAMVDRYVHLVASQTAALSRGFSPIDRLDIPRGRRKPRLGEKTQDKKVFVRRTG